MLFYGSCLREKQLDGLMLDFYLIVSDYRAAYGKRWLAAANRLIPPNVFYFEQDGLAAKYAVLSEADFAPTERPGDEQRLGLGAVRAAVAAGVGRGRGGARAGDRRGAPRRADLACGGAADARARSRSTLWRRAFALTYSAELRAERKGRARARSSMSTPSATGGSPAPALAVARADAAARQLGVAADRREGAVGAAAGQGEPDLRRRRGLYRLEDQPPRGTDIAAEAVAAAPPAARRDYPFAAAAEVRGGSLASRASAAATALASAPTVNGLRSSSWPRRSSLSPSPT